MPDIATDLFSLPSTLGMRERWTLWKQAMARTLRSVYTGSIERLPGLAARFVFYNVRETTGTASA